MKKDILNDEKICRWCGRERAKIVWLKEDTRVYFCSHNCLARFVMHYGEFYGKVRYI